MCNVDVCQSINSSSRVKVEERRRKAVFNNDGRDEYILTRIDGCVVMNACAADWVVSRRGVGCIVIELKGSNVDRAVRQVTETTELWKRKSNIGNDKIAGVIVASGYPRCSTIVQRAQDKYAKAYKSPLHVVSNCTDVDFTTFFRFRM